MSIKNGSSRIKNNEKSLQNENQLIMLFVCGFIIFLQGEEKKRKKRVLLMEE